jgi:type VI secretion system protein ImpF
MNANLPLLSSLLDRLIDREPGVTREAERGRHQVMGEIKASVARDLEDLLNARRRCRAASAGLTELEQSLVNYGLPDFTRFTLGSGEARERFRQLLETTVGLWEPRFLSLKITLLSNTEPLDRTLRFRIDALLRAEPAPEPVAFDSVLEPGTGTFAIGRPRA